jgi:hypothetical protein
MQTEAEFNIIVNDFCKAVVAEYVDSAGAELRSILPEIVVSSDSVLTGSHPWWDDDRHWYMQDYKRQIDTLIAIKADIKDGGSKLIPIIAGELKSGCNLNTDELDKKSAIYGSLRELYPWVCTFFAYSDNTLRGMKDCTFMRNGRQFDVILTEWDDRTQKLLRQMILFRLEYALDYWRL